MQPGGILVDVRRSLKTDREGALTFTSGLLPSSATWRCDWNDVDGVMWQRGWRLHGGNWNGTTSLVEVWSSRRQRRERKPPWLQHKQGKTSSSRKKQAKVKPFTTQTNKVTFPPKSDSIWKTRSVNLEAGAQLSLRNKKYALFWRIKTKKKHLAKNWTAFDECNLWGENVWRTNATRMIVKLRWCNNLTHGVKL